MAKVRSLTGTLVNGFNTFNSTLISDIDKRLHLLESTAYSTADDHYGVIAGVSISADQLQRDQLMRVDTTLKAHVGDLPIRHLLDRGHDDASVFKFIDQALQSRFVIRAKLNRVYPHDPSQKLHQAALEGYHSESLSKFVWRGKVYQDARLELSWGRIELGGYPYTVVRSVVFKRSGERVFKEPMVLITNGLVSNQSQAFGIYQACLRRSRIEGVFKFLKDQLAGPPVRVGDVSSTRLCRDSKCAGLDLLGGGVFLRAASRTKPGRSGDLALQAGQK